MQLKGSPVRLVLRQPTLVAAPSHPAAAFVLQALDPPRSGIPLLKSALQKNVRLCRPAAALRVAWALLRLADPSGGIQLCGLELWSTALL